MVDTLDTFICVHKRDLGYLFEMVLRSYVQNFTPKSRLMLISNDLPRLEEFTASLGLGEQVTLSSDDQWLSKEEMTLPGWYRQQIIKLRAYEFCETPNFCNLGADTMLLQPITSGDLVSNNLPITYYTRRSLLSSHYWYEWLSVLYVGRILKTKPKTARHYVDFISDLFTFNREDLIGLNKYLAKLYGPNYYYTLLQGFGNDSKNQKKFGEWTLYSIYVLDYLKRDVLIKNSAAGYLRQLHTQQNLQEYKFDSKLVHFVRKDFDVDYIRQKLAAHVFDVQPSRALEMEQRV